MRATPPELRLLWWMRHVGEYPSATMCTVRDGSSVTRVPNRFHWGGQTISYLSPVGLGAPKLSPLLTRGMIVKGLVEVEPEDVASNVIAFPDPKWSEAEKHRQANYRQRGIRTLVRKEVCLLPTREALALVPELPPLPWIPDMNCRSDVVRTEVERQANIRQHDTIAARMA